MARIPALHGCSFCDGSLAFIASVTHAVRELRDSSAVGVAQQSDDAPYGFGRRRFLQSAAGLVGLLGFSCRSTPKSASGVTVFHGGSILPVDAGFTQADAMAIRNGRILAVGSRAEVLAAAGEGAAKIDLRGRVVLPGFVDAHTHVVSGSVVASVAANVGMAHFATAEQVLAELGRRAESTPDGEWVVGRNYDPAVQDGPDELTFAELDRVSTRHPVFVLNASGHLAYANSKAFEAAAIPPDVANPPGGEFGRDESGRLNGVMKNNVAYLPVLEHYPQLAMADPVESLIALLEGWGRFGLTTVSELSLGALSQSPADVQILGAAARSGRLTARIRGYPFYTIPTDEWDDAGVAPGDDPIARIAGYKLVADGSNQGFTGLQREPYLNSNSRGIAYMSPEDLTRDAVDRAKKGWHLSLHANGDAGVDNVLDACEAIRAEGLDLAKVRPRIEHCSILHDDQIRRMKELGVTPSFLIGHVHYWGVWMRDSVFGEPKARLLDRCRSVEQAGLRFSLHSDFPVTDPDPLHLIQMAVTRRTWKEPEYRLAPEEGVSVEAAIRALTHDAAWHLFSEHEVGSLEPGKYADFVVLDDDPRQVDPEKIKDIAVLETWMNGRQVYRA